MLKISLDICSESLQLLYRKVVVDKMLMKFFPDNHELHFVPIHLFAIGSCFKSFVWA